MASNKKYKTGATVANGALHMLPTCTAASLVGWGGGAKEDPPSLGPGLQTEKNVSEGFSIAGVEDGGVAGAKKRAMTSLLIRSFPEYYPKN